MGLKCSVYTGCENKGMIFDLLVNRHLIGTLTLKISALFFSFLSFSNFLRLLDFDENYRYISEIQLNFKLLALD